MPGLYNDRTVANIGAACDPTDTTPDCWSPFGAGRCLGGEGTVWAPSNHCTVLDCAAPGAPPDMCGPGGACVVAFNSGVGDTPDLGACFRECDRATECSPGYACLPESNLVMGGREQGLCFPLCVDDANCRAGETCETEPGSFAGQCR